MVWMGNGGSAADSQHLAAEFMVRYKAERGPLASIALTTDTSVIFINPLFTPDRFVEIKILRN